MRTERRSTMQPRLSMMPATQSMCRKKSDTEAQLEQARKEIENAERMMGDSSVIDQKQAELDAAKAELDKGQAEYERGLKQFNAKAKARLRRGG